MTCPHVWRIVEKQEQPSPFEIIASRTWGKVELKGLENPGTRPLIVTYRCERCEGEKVERV